MQRLYNLYQYENENVQNFKQRIANAVQVVYHCGGSIGEFDKMVDKRIIEEGSDVDVIRADEIQLEKIKEKCRDRFTGILMLVLAHNSRFGKLRNELENNYTKGKDEYPKSFDDSYSMLYYRVDEVRRSQHRREKDDEGMVFNTNEESSDLGEENESQQLTTNGTKKRVNAEPLTCLRCNVTGARNSDIMQITPTALNTQIMTTPDQTLTIWEMIKMV